VIRGASLRLDSAAIEIGKIDHTGRHHASAVTEALSMFTTLFFTMSLAWQSGITADRERFDLIEKMYETQAHHEALGRALERQFDSIRQRQFEKRFNDMARALADFGETWNQSHRVDERKAKRLKKAWRDLGKSDGWFNTLPDSK
jgi:hypothetical protein